MSDRKKIYALLVQERNITKEEAAKAFNAMYRSEKLDITRRALGVTKK